MHRTILVHNRHAWRSYRTQAAVDAAHGLQLLMVEHLVARLAGGFLEPIDSDELNTAIASAASENSLGAFDAIKALPGFRRAVAATLAKAWTAGVDFAKEMGIATDAAKSCLHSLAVLETQVLARLPRNQLRPCDLVSAAIARVSHSLALFGRIEVHGHTEMAPVWRPMLSAIAQVTEIVWIAEARHVPDWIPAAGIKVKARAPEKPSVGAVCCASPRHEVLEALRWARQHLAQGVLPQQIAIAAASPEAWDDHMLALAEAANLPIHFVHGRAVLSIAEGQLAASLAELLLRGFSRTRLIRLVGLLRSQNERFTELPGDWWRAFPEDAPLLSADRWQRSITALTLESFSDGVDHRPLLAEIIATIGKGLNEAADIGESLLQSRALAIWRKALSEGPAAALDVTLGGLRADDGAEPEAAIVWAPASAIAAVPRPFTWLIGLSSRSWPRRATEDPLLPDHVVSSERLDPLPIYQADRRDFQSIRSMTIREVVCSRTRRDSEGRINGISPLYPRNVEERYLAQSREPDHAASPSDRLFARPSEFAARPHARAASLTWLDWHSDRITAHDGLVRPDHPLLIRALDRRQSAASLVKLLRDPLGYLWTYGFGWRAPEETDDPLTLDPLAFGNLVHEVLQEAVTHLESAQRGGFASASAQMLSEAIQAAGDSVASRWDESMPVPPPVVWRRKREEAMELARVALSYQEARLPGQRSWAEIPFGGDRRAETVSAEVRGTLPWDPMTPVTIPGTNVRIGGSIDRLDLAEDHGHARVTDYKSGRLRGRPRQLNGGAELQRCLYAYAVKALIATRPEVDARLLYPRQEGRLLPLDQPEATLERLRGYISAAAASFVSGRALPGPAAHDSWYDLAFALPGGASENYLNAKAPSVQQDLAAIAPLWEEP